MSKEGYPTKEQLQLVAITDESFDPAAELYKLSFYQDMDPEKRAHLWLCIGMLVGQNQKLEGTVRYLQGRERKRGTSSDASQEDVVRVDGKKSGGQAD